MKPISVFLVLVLSFVAGCTEVEIRRYPDSRLPEGEPRNAAPVDPVDEHMLTDSLGTVVSD